MTVQRPDKIGTRQYLKRPFIPVPPLAKEVVRTGTIMGFLVEQSWGGRLWDVATVNLFHPDWPDCASPQLVAVWSCLPIPGDDWTFRRCTLYPDRYNRNRRIVHTEDEARTMLAEFAAIDTGKAPQWISPYLLP